MKQAPPHRLRRLSDEEIALWTEVARSVSRRRGASLPAPSKPSVPRSPAAPPSAPAPRAEAKAAKPPALPLAPNTGLAANLKGKVPELYEAGDCAMPSLIVDAIASGSKAARNL